MPILYRAICCNGVRGPRAGRFVRFLASVGAKFTKMGDSLPWTPMNRRAKFDAASFILGREIRNRTNKHTQREVSDIFTPSLSACVDNNEYLSFILLNKFCIVLYCGLQLRVIIIRCYVTLSSWAIDDSRLQLDFDGPADFVYSNYSECNEWMLVASSASKHTEVYHGVNHEPLSFTQLTYSMTIRRRVGFYVYALIVPSVLLSFMMPLAFWIPPIGDGRITLGICYAGRVKR